MTAPILSPPLRVWDNAAVLLHTGKRKGARVVTTSALLLELSLRGLADQRNSGDRLCAAALVAIASPAREQ
jgi:hypothetical protein